MSRSYRKTPAGDCRSSEKEDKKIWHSRYRHACRQKIHIEGEDLELLPHFRELSNPWEMAKDGKVYWGDDSWWGRDSFYWTNGELVIYSTKEDKQRRYRQMMRK